MYRTTFNLHKLVSGPFANALTVCLCSEAYSPFRKTTSSMRLRCTDFSVRGRRHACVCIFLIENSAKAGERMLKKNTREIRFVRMTLLQKVKNSKEEPHIFQSSVNGQDALKECFSRLQQQYEKDPRSLNYLRNNNKLRRAIRCLSFGEDGLLTILWSIGDKDTTNPSFWHDTTDQIRSVSAAEDERVACSGHMVLSFEHVPQVGGYIACMEEVSQLGAMSIEETLNYFFSRYISIQRQDEAEPDKANELVVRVRIDPLASRDFEEAMMGRKPLAIIAETSGTASAFDEKYERIEKQSCTIKVGSSSTLEEFCNIFRALQSERKYKKYTIRYEDASKAKRSMSVSDSELEEHDLATYLFSQRDQIRIDVPIEQCCREIHTELERKMKALLLQEQKYVLRNYSEPQ